MVKILYIYLLMRVEFPIWAVYQRQLNQSRSDKVKFNNRGSCDSAELYIMRQFSDLFVSLISDNSVTVPDFGHYIEQSALL